MRCHACEARDSASAKWAKDDHSSSHGMYFVVTPEADDPDVGGENAC